MAKAVSMLDRFLAKSISGGKPIHLKNLQLVGATCMLIANKVEDNLFGINEIYEAAGCKYEIDEILQYEQ